MKRWHGALVLVAGLAAFSGCLQVLGDIRFDGQGTGGATGSGGSGASTASSSSSGTGTGGATSSASSSSSTSGGGTCTPGTMVPCYDGPTGTEDAGACHGGMAVCNAGGTGVGTCTGEQMPGTEACPSTTDTNCDGFVCSQTKWATAFGTPVVDSSGAVGVDGAGNVYVAGSFGGESAGVAVKIGTAQLITAGGSDIFVAKFDPKGNVLWAKRFGDVGNESVSSMAVDKSGNMVLTGFSDEAVDFGGATGPVMGQIFVVELDTSGKQIWATSCGGAPFNGINSGGVGVGIDPNGDVALAGTFGGSANCGDMAHTTVAMDILVAKLSGANGQATWSKSFGNGKMQYLSGLAVDGSGNILVNGALYGTTALGFGTMMVTGPGMYAARLSPSGGVSWARAYAVGASLFPGGIAVDSLGGPVMVGGYMSAAVNFGDGALPGSNGGYIAKLDASGTLTWSKGYSSGHSIAGVTVDASDDIAFVGTGATDLGGGAVSGVFVGKFTSGGSHIWSRGFGAYGYGTPAFGPGVLAISGSYQGTIDFGTGTTYMSTGGGSVSDVFVVALSP